MTTDEQTTELVPDVIDQFGREMAHHLREATEDGAPADELVDVMRTWVETLLTCHFCGTQGLPGTCGCDAEEADRG